MFLLSKNNKNPVVIDSLSLSIIELASSDTEYLINQKTSDSLSELDKSFTKRGYREKEGKLIGQNRLFKTELKKNYNLKNINIKPHVRMGNTGPGPQELIAGDMDAGFFGTLPASELFTGSELSSAVGISAGTLQHNTTDWLKFAYEGKILFRPMKAIRYSISWNQINAAGCVFGEKTVEKDGLEFKVRLMKGALTNPSMYTNSDRGAMGSEWNRLMLPIHEQAKDGSWAYPQYVESDIPDWDIGFTDADLLTHRSHGDGSYVWCQETRNDNTSTRVNRGGNGVSISNSPPASNVTTIRGWAPILELLD